MGNWEQLASLEPESKKVPKQHVETCKKHKIKLYGRVPCPECMKKVETFKGHPRLIEDLQNANIFAKHLGVDFKAMDPGVRFGIHHQWYESFEMSSEVLKKLVENLKKTIKE